VPSTVSILGQIPPAEFLRNHYRQKQLFIPSAVERTVSVLTPSELAGLSCEESVESRLVTQTRDRNNRGQPIKRPYRLSHGPFEPDVFARLGMQDWTLLVQDVDKLVPRVHTLLELVSFLPRWSIDDIMVSYAVDGGSVGPHTDRYDVFLLQAEGTRRWQVSKNVDETRLRTDTDLRILAEFEPEEEYLAHPGDVLYLPAGVGHYGVAEGECMTYSFGFRAPTEAALVSHFGDEMTANSGEAQLYEKLATPPSSPSALSTDVLRRARSMIQERFSELMSNERSIGRYLTSPKPHLEAPTPEIEWTESRVRERLSAGARVVRSMTSRFLYSDENGEVVLFVDGQDYSLGKGERARTLAQRLCEATPVFSASHGASSANIALVLELLSRGALSVAE
jgi:50S ribosomal protein L16 3-hydroxylase